MQLGSIARGTLGSRAIVLVIRALEKSPRPHVLIVFGSLLGAAGASDSRSLGRSESV